MLENQDDRAREIKKRVKELIGVLKKEGLYDVGESLKISILPILEPGDETFISVRFRQRNKFPDGKELVDQDWDQIRSLPWSKKLKPVIEVLYNKRGCGASNLEIDAENHKMVNLGHIDNLFREAGLPYRLKGRGKVGWKIVHVS